MIVFTLFYVIGMILHASIWGYCYYCDKTHYEDYFKNNDNLTPFEKQNQQKHFEIMKYHARLLLATPVWFPVLFTYVSMVIFTDAKTPPRPYPPVLTSEKENLND